MTAAIVAHSTRGRARLRLPSVKGDRGFFERLEQDLRHFRGVVRVKVNARTGSVLLHHRGDIRDVVKQAEQQGIFELVERPPRGEPLDVLREKLTEVNDSLRGKTKNVADLRSIAFATLIGGSVYQLFHGRFLPAGGTMLMQALDVLFELRRRDD